MNCLTGIVGFIEKGPNIFNVRSFGAKLDDSTDDLAAFNAAVSAASAPGGGNVLVDGNAFISGPIDQKNHVRILCLPGLARYSIRTTMSASDDRGIVNIIGRTNIAIENLKLIVNGGSNAITTYGHDGLFIKDVDISGTTTSQSGPILLNGGSTTSTGVMTRTFIERVNFHDLPNSIRPIRLYARNGHTISHTFIRDCYFKGTTKNTISLDCYDQTFNTVVEGNRFEDIIGDSTDAATAVWTNSSTTDYLVNGLFVFNNTYINTLTATSQRQGFIYFYNCKNVVIAGNRMIGAWTAAQAVTGPAIAPGRIDSPNISVKISDNYISGFDAAWDPDGQIDTDVHDNSIIRCGLSFGTGYSVQDSVRIHDNYSYNSPASGTNALLTLGASTWEKNCSVYNNTFVDDRPVPRFHPVSSQRCNPAGR